MKQILDKYIGKQQYLYIALAVVGMCLAGASLVLADDSAGLLGQEANATEAR